MKSGKIHREKCWRRSLPLLLFLWYSLLPSLLGAWPPESSGAELKLVRRAHFVMGTVFEISAYGEDPARTADSIEEAFTAIQRADRIMSDYRDDSDLTRLNRNGADTFVPLPGELYSVLQESVKYSRLTGGAFDVTIGSLVDAWRQAAARAKPVSDTERSRLLPAIGECHLLFAGEQQAVRFDRSGVRVDLGGIAKGWAVDQAAAVLRNLGIRRALISAGSSTMYAIGSPPAQEAWKIGIRHPLTGGKLLAVVSLKDSSLSTSASYERKLRIHGKTYSHILDPRTGLPAQTMLSSTVIASTALESDALSTGTFVLGIEQAEDLLRRMHLSGLLAAQGKKTSEVVVRSIPSAGESSFWQ